MAAILNSKMADTPHLEETNIIRNDLKDSDPGARRLVKCPAQLKMQIR